jgi:OmcA/MtrC family decaheme c-type cytochrome
MKRFLVRSGAATLAALAVALSGCGGGGGGTPDTTTPGGGGSPAPVPPAISAAAALPANDTAVNPSAALAVVQTAGVPAVTISSPPKVNFTVFSDGKVNPSVTLGSVSFAIAKLVPGTNGNPDQWVSYVYRTRAAATASASATYTPAVRATLSTPKYATATQAYLDPKQTDPTLAAGQLVFNPDGYYTYTFTTNIKDPTKTNGVVFEPGRTHRIAIQLAYTNAAGATVYVNPTFDFTVDASGNSVPVTNASQTRKVVDVATCNNCHQKLVHHGNGRVDTQFCVICHSTTSTDPNSGNTLNFATMVHKIHSAKLLASQAGAGGGENYTIRTDDLSDIGFPQDLRNCTVCHTGANPATPQGDNWKTRPSREACLTCHASNPGSDWYNVHFVINSNRDPNATATLLTDTACAGCHIPGSAIAPERVHFNQVQADAALYKMNIESAVFDPAARVVNVKYFLSNPANGGTAYNLVTPDCTGSGSTLACSGNAKFGNLRFYLAYESMVGQPLGTTEFTSYNNGGSTANVYAYKGVNDGGNHYTASIPVPADTPASVVQGTGRVISIGQVKEPQLAAQAATDPRPAVSPQVLLNVGVQHTSVDLALTGSLVARRQVVSTEKCNVCHGMLGTASGSNTLDNAFHGGARNQVEACVVCHDPNRMSTTIMTNGLALNESFQFKRMIHGIHGNAERTYPFTHGNAVQGVFNKDGTSATGGAPLASTVENYAAEVAYPQASLNCNACHVNDSYKVDRSPLGAVVSKPAAVTDPMQWKVISPKAATCTSCHDSPTAIGHVTSFGNASYGDRTQAQSLQTQEACTDCHAPGVFKGVDIVHGLQ